MGLLYESKKVDPSLISSYTYYRLRYRYDAEDGNVGLHNSFGNLSYGNLHNFTEFTYEGSHATPWGGYSTTSISGNNPEGVMRTYAFNNKHLLTKIETKVNPNTQNAAGYAKRQDELFEYNASNHLTRREQIFYNNGIEQGL